jgi:hypothetical protein
MKANKHKARPQVRPRKLILDDTTADLAVVRLFKTITARGRRERAAWADLVTYLVRKKHNRAPRRRQGRATNMDAGQYNRGRELEPQTKMMKGYEVCDFLDIPLRDFIGLRQMRHFPVPDEQKPDRWTENQMQRYKRHLEACCGVKWSVRDLYTRWEPNWPDDEQ